MTQKFQCIGCLRYRKDGGCDAFPKGIPYEILFGSHDHREPFRGDGGIQFEPLADDDGRTA
jgi:hypothetical protein